MTKPLRWGVLGASNFALRHMAPAIHAASGAELVALATSSPEKAAGFQDFCPGLKVHLSYEALLADPNVDAVYIPLPNHLHVEWVMKALDAGKHVLCEKPLAMKAEEFDAVIAKRDATGLLAAEAFMIVQHPQWIRAKQLLAEGAIGRVNHVDVAFTYDNRGDAANIRNRPETGGGSIPDIGVYAYGSVRFALGAEPKGLEARIAYENGVDVFAEVTGTMTAPQGDFTYRGMTSMRLFPRQEVVFQGDTGMIRLTAPFNAEVFAEPVLELHRMGFVSTYERFPMARHYRLQVEKFGRSVREGVAYPCPLEFSKGTQAMIDQIFAVAKPV
jgi:predicted dehydrogenase